MERAGAATRGCVNLRVARRVECAASASAQWMTANVARSPVTATWTRPLTRSSEARFFYGARRRMRPARGTSSRIPQATSSAVFGSRSPNRAAVSSAAGHSPTRRSACPHCRSVCYRRPRRSLPRCPMTRPFPLRWGPRQACPCPRRSACHLAQQRFSPRSTRRSNRRCLHDLTRHPEACRFARRSTCPLEACRFDRRSSCPLANCSFFHRSTCPLEPCRFDRR
jgi:hypothetical protein